MTTQEWHKVFEAETRDPNEPLEVQLAERILSELKGYGMVDLAVRRDDAVSLGNALKALQQIDAEAFKWLRRGLARLLSAGLLVLLLVAPAAAAPIHFAASTEPADLQGANLTYQPFPGASLAGLFVPTDVDVTFDPAVGSVNIAAWRAYNADRSAVIYEFPAQDLLLSQNALGEFVGPASGGAIVTLVPPGPAGFHLYANFSAPQPVINAPLIPAFPGLTTFRLNALVAETPEPTGLVLVMMALFGLSLLLVRRHNRKRRQQN